MPTDSFIMQSLNQDQLAADTLLGTFSASASPISEQLTLRCPGSYRSAVL
jgi:hypothetical protein